MAEIRLHELPREYAKFLAKLDPEMQEALYPVFEQSVAEGEHGVLIRGPLHETQAMVSDDIPFGKIRDIQVH
ncbi:hypothetical protein [Arthrobacter sp. H14]|uniref:hypothetical protein n=1 Tax=Arthrobacter sp. H14 TaxID=1312959 RepID=UPI0012DEACF6|nr:hypothetical protein [Arthrobacter sp. H14]